MGTPNPLTAGGGSPTAVVTDSRRRLLTKVYGDRLTNGGCNATDSRQRLTDGTGGSDGASGAG